MSEENKPVSVSVKDRLKDLVKLRSSMKAKLTQFENYLKPIDQPLNELQFAELECRLNKIDSLLDAFDKLQTEFETLSEDSPDLYTERELFESRYFSLVARARTLLESVRRRQRSPSPGEASSRSSRLASGHDFVRLPRINLGTFSGGFQDWLSFRDMYVSLIHSNTSLSDINKFHYLRAALKGSASLIIQSLEFTADNYKIAWQLLSNRYDNERLLVNNHVSALFSLQQAQTESSAVLRNIIDVTNKNLCALSTLGQPTDHWDTLIIYIMSKKLDNITFRKWEEHRNDITSSPTLKQFTDFLINRADFLDTINQGNNNSHISDTHIKQKTQQFDSNKIKTSKSFPNQTNKTSSSVCPMCKQNHYLFNCQEFRKLDVDSRLQKIANYQICKNCLRPGHKEKQCTLSHCKYCTQKHNTLLHKETDIDHNVVALSTNVLPSMPSQTPHVILSTALVKVADAEGGLHTARLVLDSASTSNFITKRLCEQLRPIRRNTGSTVKGINNQNSFSAESCDLTLESCSGDFKVHLNCYVLPKITNSLPSSYLDLKYLPEIPSNIQLADPTFNIPSDIDLLVGAEAFWDILGSKIISLGNQYPKLRESKLGWLITGAIPIHNSQTKHSECYFTQIKNSECYFTQDIESQLSKFWELDSVSSVHCVSAEEKACERNFSEHTRRAENGQFIVKIPLKDSPDILGDSYSLAKRRFLSLERKLQRDSNLKTLYHDFMLEYITLGHMSENTESTHINKVNYYLPHHGVIRESSTTTKLRVVFDASAATTSGKSLNDIQLVGPVVQDDLLSILLRFRQHKFVISGDIQHMYRAILVDQSQRSLQQIIFRFDNLQPLKTFTLNTVSFGMSSAPYLATKCLATLAEQSPFPEVKTAIGRDMYVDDYLSGGDTIESVFNTTKKVIDTLKSAKFNLRKFQSNNSDLLSWIVQYSDTQNSNLTHKTLDLNQAIPYKTLGLHWMSTHDELLFSIDLDVHINKITKRKILSIISQVFDPLGLLGLCTVEAKMIMQKLWLQKCGWDDEVTLDIRTRFINFIQSLKSLNVLRIPRWFCCNNAVVHELHIFTDASERAYGACVYVRSIDTNGKVCVRLLISKNKLVPLKPPITIARAELCAALLGSRLCSKVKSSLTMNFGKIQFWCDSTIVLAWLKTSPSKLKTFVRNRVGEIQDSTASDSWSYVPSVDNPADLVSRGVRANDVNSNSLWWNGPNFLKDMIIRFPKITPKCPDPLPEICLHTSLEDSGQILSIHNNNAIVKLINKSSNPDKLIRIVAYLRRYIHNCQNPLNKILDHLSLDELKNAENLIIQTVQKEIFFIEYNALKSKQNLHKNNRLISLSPFLDDNNIIRVGGRLDNSFYTYDVKHPILLCSKHHFTQILFQREHVNLFHAGPQLLLSHLRQKYWPLGGRNLARRVVHCCIRCRRFKSQYIQPVMGQLPNDRSYLEFPFLNTGIDYCGPILISDRKGRGSKLLKSYICVFVCFAVKAVHLELVTDLTKEAFLAALNRFIARRGKPQRIYSDNATTFVGASNDIVKFFREYSNDIQHESLNIGIDFRQIPPYSPHFGGLWEAAVKAVKHHLRRVLSLTYLNYEEMSTCLVQIEAILNSRPLTPLSQDPSDFTCLTPSHFLIGRSLTTVPHPPLIDANVSRLQRYQRIEHLKQHFWQRYSIEYVSLLQQKTKWQSSTDSLKIGTLVLVRDKNQHPLLWLLGRVTKTYPGPDGISRVAELATKKGTITRAYTHICPLPVNC